jgi:hypothetical protein
LGAGVIERGEADVGLLPVGADAAEGLYRIVESAYERKSMAICANLRSSECVSAISGFESSAVRRHTAGG